MTALAPETLILDDESALAALKRAQLVALCKVHDIKANGKNVELIAKLQTHGRALQKIEEGDVSTASSWAVVSEPDEDAQAEAEQMQVDFGVQSGSAHSTNGTGVSTSSSSSSLASTIRSVSGSILKRLQHSPAKLSTPLGSPAPPPPAPAPSSPAPQLPTTTDGTSSLPPTPKIYPSLSPASIRSYSASGSPRPTVHSTFTADSPRSYMSGGIRVVATQPDDSFEEGASMDSIEVPTTTFELPQTAPKGTTRIGRLASGDTPPPAPSPAFIFGSPSNSASSFAPAPFTFTAPSTSTLLAGSSAEIAGKTAAELVMEEMTRRALESKASGVVYGSSVSREKEAGAPGTAEKRKFEGAHKRAFDKMDSIANHYAAKRSALTPSTSSTTLMRSSSSSRSIHQSTGISTQPSAKRMKLPPSASASLLKSTSSKSMSKAGSSTSSDKKIVSNLLGEGWASAAPTQSVSLAASIRSTTGTASRFGAPSTFASSTLGKGTAKEMREGLYPNDGKDEERAREAEQRGKERAERKRKLELAKARRKSQVGAGTGGAGGNRRRSTTVGPKLRDGNAASRFFKSAVKKFTTTTPVPPLPSASTSTIRTLPRSTSSAALPSLADSTSSRVTAFSPTTSKPAFNAGPSRAFALSSSTASSSTIKGSSPQVKKEPGLKRFNLQESLAKPLSYTPKLGPINRDSSAFTPHSKSRPVSSISSLASASTAFGTTAPCHKRTSSLSRPNGPARGLSLSKRVANPAMLGAVKPGSSVPTDKLEEEIASAQEQNPEQDVQMPGSFVFNFPSVPKTSIPFIFPSLPSSLVSFPLASPTASDCTSSALQPVTNTPFSPPSTSTSTDTRASGTPLKKSGIPSSVRKTRTAAGSKLGGGTKGSKLQKTELESKARKVVAKRVGGVGAAAKRKAL